MILAFNWPYGLICITSPHASFMSSVCVLYERGGWSPSICISSAQFVSPRSVYISVHVLYGSLQFVFQVLNNLPHVIQFKSARMSSTGVRQFVFQVHCLAICEFRFKCFLLDSPVDSVSMTGHTWQCVQFVRCTACNLAKTPTISE